MTNGRWRSTTSIGDSHGHMSPIGPWAARTWVATIVSCFTVAAILSGCSAGDTGTAAADQGRCDFGLHVERVVHQPRRAGRHHQAVRGLGGLGPFGRGAPAAFGGHDPMALLADRCADDTSGLADYAVCGTLRIGACDPDTQSNTQTDAEAHDQTGTEGSEHPASRFPAVSPGEADATAGGESDRATLRQLHATSRCLPPRGRSPGRDRPRERQQLQGDELLQERRSVQRQLGQ